MFEDWLVLDLTQFQMYGLVFLLGSFVVAALSDVRYQSAQVEFVEVWALCLAAFLVIELWELSEPGYWDFIAKLILIAVFALLANRSFGILFKLAAGDVLACAAVMALLTPVLILVFIIGLKILDFIMRPILKFFGKGGAYPFMPVPLVATVVLFSALFYLV